jgi:hypothetical protein
LLLGPRLNTALAVDAMAEPTCPRCLQPVSPDDTVTFGGSQIMHLDCRQPRDLLRQERVLLFGHCWGHSIICPACGNAVQLFELNSNRFERDKLRNCPRCQRDLTESVRDHLYNCSLSPEVLRRAALEVRETTRMLIKQVSELRNREEVLIREAEATLREVRDGMKQSVSEALRRTIRQRLREHRLPRGDGLPPILGCPGDGSPCAACDRPISKEHLMMVVGTVPAGVALHAADCFPLWDEERLTFQLST